VVIVAAATLVFARPLVVDSLFNRFEPLPRGPLRSDVLALARTAGIRVSEVYVMDASRRTTGANAYVAGLGATKRIVLYDTLVRDFPPADAFALRSTDAPDVGIALQRRLVIRNVADPAPPRLVTQLLGTHPSPMARIGFALAYGEREERSSGG